MTDLAAIERADRQGLASLWMHLIGGPVPARMSQSVQRHFVAFALQARLTGGLPAGLSRRLALVAAGGRGKTAPALRVGARLLREWNGTTHVVEVVTGGYRWNGQCHRSLSVIARTITGARWSGPRFFGLSATPTPSKPDRAADAARAGRPAKARAAAHRPAGKEAAVWS